jgi:hypothetical protein
MDLLKEARNQGHEFQLLQKPVHPTELLLKIGSLGATQPPNETVAVASTNYTSQIQAPLALVAREHLSGTPASLLCMPH